MKHLLVIIFSIGIMSPIMSQVAYGKVKEGDVYKLEDSTVNKELYSDFLSKLEKVEGTYVCKKTVNGGHNWYRAKAKNRKVYVVSSLLDNEKWYYHIFEAIELNVKE